MKALKEIKIINGERGVDISDEEIQKYVEKNISIHMLRWRVLILLSMEKK